jgi:hypothetical protein
MDKILNRLELSADVKGALLERHGPLGNPYDSSKHMRKRIGTPREDSPTRPRFRTTWSPVSISTRCTGPRSRSRPDADRSDAPNKEEARTADNR